MIVKTMGTKQKKCGICFKKRANHKLPNTFTDLDKIKTFIVCDLCIELFSTEWLKTSFYHTNNGKYKIKQCDFYNILHNIELPCLLSFTESRKKHRLFRTRLSTEKSHIFISTDTGDVVINLNSDLKLLNYLQKIYKENKLSKNWFLGDFPVNAIKKMGLRKYIELQKKTHHIKNTPKFNLLVKFINR